MQLVRRISRPRHLSLTLLGSLLPLAALADTPVTLKNEVITATQTAHSELSAPASVSVVTREELDKLPVYNLADAVKYLPGVHINPSSTYGRKEIKLRGMDSDYTLLLVNGRRINSRDVLTSEYANDFDLSSIPMAAIERIEVIRGPMSSLYGADAIGGVVNVILRQAGNQTRGGVAYSYETPTEGDGGDSHKTSGYISGALIEDKLLGNLIVEGTDKAAWRSDQTVARGADAAEHRQDASAYGSLSWLLDERQTIDLDITHRQDDRVANWYPSARYGVIQNDQEMERTSFGLSHTGRWDSFNSRVRYYYEDVELADASALMTRFNNGIVGQAEQQNHTVDGQLSGVVANQLVTVGAERRRTEFSHNQNLGTETNVDQYALYLQDEFSLGQLDVTLGGRWDHHEVFGSEFSPRAYGVYNLTDNWVIKGGVGKSFKAPAIYQSDETYSIAACQGGCRVKGNAELKPETAVSYEIGTLYQNERLEAGITLFQTEIDDMIISDRWRAGYRPPVMTYTNISKARIRGYELQGRYALNDVLGLRGNYTYSDAEDREAETPLNNTPQHLASLGLDWQALPALALNLDYQYVGSQWLSTPASGSQESGAFHTLNFGARYQATNHLTLNGGLNNLTNEKRDNVAQSVDNILMGRTLFVGFNYDI
ncbi:TonB-dependent receptor domain-containing protein [Stutzerimonas degradans]|uniref:TonB-dependent receptor n=1 Tax=Stutzerimonas degradans TaxID=2968968 RepID=A0A8E2U2J2_9GAMM|nr:TonB-dependent receptor [Stutzerimonas degradans]MCQ4274380.1 TonB-dependent receptor [Stutzerimonas degradans]PNF77817.1 TonB-dependent receptor [Stutzerimonas degradans]QPT23209.1 TonB-dependent receptor [Stutzerimonas degradans]